MIVYRQCTIRKYYTRIQIDVFVVICATLCHELCIIKRLIIQQNLIQNSCAHVCSQFVLVLISFYRKYKTP